MARRLIIEADGGARGNPGPAAYGAVVRDAASGDVLAERAEAIGVATNNVAEYRGLIAGLTVVHEIDPAADVEIRMDSKLVVEQMAGRWKIKNAGLQPLALQARRLLPGGRVTWTWIPRSRNAHADRLLNEALDAAGAPEPQTVGVTEPESVGAEAEPVGAEPQEAGVEAEAVRIEPEAVRIEPGPVGPPEPASTIAGAGVTQTTFLLVRHAATDLTAAGRFNGAGGQDVSLSPVGQKQAVALAEALAERGDVTVVVSSPLQRCRETASVIAARLGLDVETDPAWREAGFGEWEGRTFAEIQQRWSAELESWLATTSAAPPGGESLDDMARRVIAARDKILSRHAGGTALVVTHGGPVKVLTAVALGAPPSSVFRMTVEPASRTEIAYYSDGNRTVRTFGA